MLPARVIAFAAALSLALAPTQAMGVQEPQPHAQRHEAPGVGGLPPLVTLFLISIGVIGVLYLLGTVIDGDGDRVSP
jgi:hypothetical protein